MSTMIFIVHELKRIRECDVGSLDKNMDDFYEAHDE